MTRGTMATITSVGVLLIGVVAIGQSRIDIPSESSVNPWMHLYNLPEALCVLSLPKYAKIAPSLCFLLPTTGSDRSTLSRVKFGTHFGNQVRNEWDERLLRLAETR